MGEGEGTSKEESSPLIKPRLDTNYLLNDQSVTSS